MNKPFILSSELVRKVVETVDKGLVKGVGIQKPGHMCVEAAVCYAMGLPHGDEPTCVDPAIRRLKINLNDSNWSSDAARAKGMRRLAVLQLGTKESGFDSIDFAKRVALMTIKVILPIALTAAGLHDHAETCKNVTTLEHGHAAAHAAHAALAAGYAAGYAADAAGYAAAHAAHAAAHAAGYAAGYAADAAGYAAAHAAHAAAHAAGYAAGYAAAHAADAAAHAADAAGYAAAHAAGYAAHAAGCAAAGYAAAHAAHAAAHAAHAAAHAAGYAAAHAAARDNTLSVFAKGVEDILIDMGVPAVSFLDLLEE